MKYLFRLMFLSSALYVPHAWGQEQGCPAGIPSAGNPECLPPDDSNSPYYQGDRNQQAQLPQEPQAEWANRFGAIAVDGDTASVGVSENQTSKSAASKEAMRNCASKLNSQHCEVQMTYVNECTALVWGTGHYGVAGGINASVAQKEAFAKCAEGASDCKIFYAACSLPVRLQ